MSFAPVFADAVGSSLISVGGALLGVMLGGVLSFAIQQRSEANSRRALSRAGCQVIRAELRTVDRTLSGAIYSKMWQKRRSIAVPAWESYKEVLALELDEPVWQTAAVAVAEIEGLASELEKLPGPGETVALGHCEAKAATVLTCLRHADGALSADRDGPAPTSRHG